MKAQRAAAIPKSCEAAVCAGQRPFDPRDSISRWMEETRRACGAFEWVTFAYLGWLLAILAAFHHNLAHAKTAAALHMAALLGIVVLCRAVTRSQNELLQFARHWYPLPLYLWLFEELGGLVHAIFPAWFDGVLIQFDYNFAGVHPSVWLSRFANPALNDFMQFAYLTYFLYLLILPAILYSQREMVAFWAVMVSTAIAHFSVYVIALLFPVESPCYSLAALQTKRLTGGGVTTLMNLIERFGGVHGAAFPSAHVAGALVAILASWRYRRWLFWICLPFFLCMCVATVYGRYHYVADVLGGLVVGTIGFLAGSWLIERKDAVPEIRGEQNSE
jgi:membrane-associated phospholipid phosphatase